MKIISMKMFVSTSSCLPCVPRPSFQACAQKAVIMLDSHQMGLKQIGVAMSAPRRPAEDQSVQQDGAKLDNLSRPVRESEGGFLKPTFIPRRALQQPEDAPV